MNEFAELDATLSDAIACPWCEEITYAPVRKDTDRSGREFIVYECEECPCQGSFSV